MKYICSVCGYVHDETTGGKWDKLPADWKCPLCGAGKDAFRPQEAAATDAAEIEKPHVERELSPIELSIICSNLARGCEKQYMDAEAANFRTLSEFFKSKAQPADSADAGEILALIEKDLSRGYPYANQESGRKPDRGALRALVWSEKVTRMLQSLLSRYEAEGEAMTKGTGVWVCSICGFVYVGDSAPELCPVCKVPAWKFDKMEGRA